MYLCKKKVEALEFALEALEFGLCNNLQPDECEFAVDVIGEMLRNFRIQERRKKLKKNVKPDGR